jgi:putative salt-induced outer membrane protein YdiY
VLAGRGRLEKGVLTVVSDEVTQTARRSDIWVILPGAPTELNRWRSTVSIGIDTYTGNTDSSGLTASSTIDREDPNSHLHVEYTGTFNQADGETVAARHRVGQSMNVYFTRLLYASLPFLDYTSDRFQNLKHRAVPGLALGYKIFDLDALEWSIDGGLAYQYTRYVSVTPDQQLRENDWGPRIATQLEWDVVTDLDLELSHQTVLLVRDFTQTNYHTRGTLSYEITDLLYIELSVWHDRIRQPRENVDNVTPEKDDFRYTFSFGLSFD